MIRAMGLDLKPARSGFAMNYDPATGEERLHVDAIGQSLIPLHEQVRIAERATWARVKTHPPDVVFIEGTFSRGSASDYGQHAVHFAVTHVLWSQRVPWVDVQTGKVKIWATGSGSQRGASKVTKDKVVAGIIARYGRVMSIPAGDDDACDAVALLTMALAMYGEPADGVPLDVMPREFSRAVKELPRSPLRSWLEEQGGMMFGLGNRTMPDPPPERSDVPADAEVIGRACWLIKGAMEDPGQTVYRGSANVPLVDLCLDLRAVLVRSDAGRAVIRPLVGAPELEDPAVRVRRELAEAREQLVRSRAAADQDVKELHGELGRTSASLIAVTGERDRLARDLEAAEIALRAMAAGLNAATGADPGSTVYVVEDGPKMLRETLCAAQSALGNSNLNAGRRTEHVNRLQRLIGACDQHRPIGPDGRHGEAHTATCGCEDRATGAHEAAPGTGEEQA